jgi:CheY-like chemotaxis protein
MPHRPLVPIVVTGTPKAETIITAMRAGAMDFLAKPIAPQDLLTSLRLASKKWLIMNNHFRMLALLEGSADIGSWSAKADEKTFGAATLSRDDLIRFVRSVIKMRHRRNDIFKSGKFSDPSWDILLDLTSARLEGRDVPAISTSAAAGVPLTTALRYVKNLTDDGIIRRWEDPNDKRRSLVRLDDVAFECMVEFLSQAHALLTAPPRSSR